MYADVAVCLPFSRTFLYEIPNPVALPARVTVPFGAREVQGFVVGFREDKPDDFPEIKPITEVLDPEPLIGPDVYELCRWIASYYMAPLGEVLRGALPPGITRKHVEEFSPAPARPQAIGKPLALTADQEAAFRDLTGGDGFRAILLHGVTGSGKTEVYLQAVRHFQQQGKTALVLVPEIGLTPQLGQRFRDRFGPGMALVHSGLSKKQRIDEWLRIYHGHATIVIGTRSALFSPLANLGIIVVDEEHESSYKQDEMPRYNARDSAVMRARMAGAVAVLGSATPSMESFRNAETRRYMYVRLPSRVEKRPLPEVEIVNMREEHVEAGQQTLFSRRLLDGLSNRLDRKEQAIVLLNRRGYSMFLLCRKCGYSFECSACSVSMTYHRSIHRLMCHYCGLTRRPATVCPECQSEYLYYVGEGTQQVEVRLKAHFPLARVGRIDRDTMRNVRDFDRVLREFGEGRIDILVGTQMVAKGHDFPNVTLVGVLSSDAALSLPDFRAAERTFQLLTQVAGRAGRGDRPGQVVIQSYFPDHYTFRLAATHRFEEFYRREIQFRQAMFYPPFTVLAGVMVQERTSERAAALAKQIGDYLESERGRSIRILGPAPAAVEKVNRVFRHQILLKSATRPPLRELLEKLRIRLEQARVQPTSVIVDVDPVTFS
jgi:primosomal protein N' (replication factor Y)